MDTFFQFGDSFWDCNPIFFILEIQDRVLLPPVKYPSQAIGEYLWPFFEMKKSNALDLHKNLNLSLKKNNTVFQVFLCKLTINNLIVEWCFTILIYSIFFCTKMLTFLFRCSHHYRNEIIRLTWQPLKNVFQR